MEWLLRDAESYWLESNSEDLARIDLSQVTWAQSAKRSLELILCEAHQNILFGIVLLCLSFETGFH